MVVPTKKEIETELELAGVTNENGSKWPSMTYEEGVVAALEWVLGESTQSPMEEEV